MAQKYDKDFKINAVQVYLSNDKSIDRIAHDLGVSRASLGARVRAYKIKGERSFPGSGFSTDPELSALKLELRSCCKFG